MRGMKVVCYWVVEVNTGYLVSSWVNSNLRFLQLMLNLKPVDSEDQARRGL